MSSLNFSFGIKKDGSLWACGNNSVGTLGNGNNSDMDAVGLKLGLKPGKQYM